MVAKASMMIMALLVAVGLVGFVQVPVSSAAIWHHSYQGQVTFYDHMSNKLVINGKNGEKTFDVSKATINGAVHPDETAMVRYSVKNGDLLASSVKVIGPQAKNDVGANNMGENDMDSVIYGPTY